MDQIIKTEKVETTEVNPASGEKETTEKVTKKVEYIKPVVTETSETVTTVVQETT